MFRPYRAEKMFWGCSFTRAFSPGYHIAGFQPDGDERDG
jgi:hypothetical protein